ncbi:MULTISPECIES: PQQ-binding-like beta-propeller repeat protein [Halobacterium]|nr:MULTISPECIES: PQQ-binding-like beta-propeller repeat protein [Halobacterium]MCF2164956.1 PQQ-binding-like beta-propeller repeat protein [Halobacterium salinarum]MCF2168465.1 PQQ-binding-like beta-propeller repeat protein [Halobacterium salinarum]QRY21699.1 PQQ-like beta-propeller repeat protein [Halobacterium sp. GSL-19]WJK64865.1 PQQ-binding-like beta-propeller repeat protein [Halobacterium salinarum]
MVDSICTRRRLLAAVGATSVSAVAGCSSTLFGGDVEYIQDAPVGEVTGPWPTYQHDFARTGATTDPGPSSDATESTVLELFNLHPDSQVMFTGDRGALALSPDEFGGSYTSFNINENTRSWNVETTGSAGSVTIAGNAAFASTSRGIRVYDIRSGDLCWRANTGSPFLGNAPVFVSGKILSWDSSSVVAYDATTGEKRWTFSFEDTGPNSVGLRDGIVYIQLETGVAAVDAESGDQVWRRSLFPGIDQRIVIGDESVYYSAEGGKLYALSTEREGETQWKTSIPNEYGHSLAVSNNRIHVSASDSSDRGVLTTLDAADGSTINIEKHPDGRTSPPIVADGTQFWLGDTTLYASDADTGSPKWSLDVNATVENYSLPSVHGSNLLFASKNGVVKISDGA